MEVNQPTSTDSSQHNSIVLKIVHWDKLFESDSPPRLGIDFGKRLPYATISAFSTGLALGYYHGSKKAGLVFRAENAHRFPTTSTGWFQYHKTKNYIGVVGGAKDGMKMGLKLGAGAFAFCLFEETGCHSPEYSLLARHDVYTAARTAKLGLKLSLTYGLLQDALETLKGNRPSYVDFFLGNRRSKAKKEGSI
ncbi:hypothetical protein PDIDSM_6631 [Penicillium digitatum]|nr:hypothetical protein PDIDSM_6631 [Penicillium digitatum]